MDETKSLELPQTLKLLSMEKYAKSQILGRKKSQATANFGYSRFRGAAGFFVFNFTVAFLLFEASAGSSNPAEKSLTLFLPNLI